MGAVDEVTVLCSVFFEDSGVGRVSLKLTERDQPLDACIARCWESRGSGSRAGVEGGEGVEPVRPANVAVV